MKYKIALLCVGKNEENYLVEFIEHYMQLGITTIFFGDNNAPQNNKQYESIKKYIDSGFVKYYNYQGVEDVQHKFYSDIYFKEIDNYDWFFAFDIDEILELDNQYKNIDEFLDDEHFKGVDVIQIKWQYMMSINFPQYHYQNKSYKELCPQKILRKSNDTYTVGLKSIFRSSKNIERVSIHHPGFYKEYTPKVMLADSFKIIDSCKAMIFFNIKEEIYMNNTKLLHYHYKSLDEYIDKVMNGRADTPKEKNYYKIQSIDKLSNWCNSIIIEENGFNEDQIQIIKNEVYTYLKENFIKQYNLYGIPIQLSEINS